jgi:hypothetical protein
MASRLAAAIAALLLLGSHGHQAATRAVVAGVDAKGAVGIEEPAAPEPEPAGSIRTPAGRLVERGASDPLGYILPLDVRRSRPAFESPPRASSGEIASRRALLPTSAFEEHRLGPDDGHTQNETSIAVHGDTLVAGWNSFTDTGLLMGVGRSTDAGHTWASALIAGHTAMSDPAVRAGGNGAWYYGYIATGGPGGSDWEVFVRRSTDAGATWQGPVAVTNDTNFDDKPYIDARGDEVLMGYADFGFSPAKVRAARSTNGGASFGSDIVLANNSVGGNGACPVIGTDGTYHVFWRDSFQESLWVASSTNQGASWSADRGIVGMHPLPSSLPGGFRIVNLPSADADPLTGALVVVWNDQLFGDPDILSIRSTDGGATWSAPIRVNDDVGTAAQWFPWIAFDEAGVAHVVWYDRRGNGAEIDVYVTRSLDGGVTFEPNTRVTAAAFTPILPWEGGAAPFIGDYNGIAAAGGVAYPFYQDAREGNQDVYVARIAASPVGVASGDGAARGAPRITATPSPFREETLLRAPGSAPGAELLIVSPEGRVVRRLAAGSDGTALWDGEDDAGRPAPAGISRVRARGGPAAGRLVKLD